MDENEISSDMKDCARCVEKYGIVDDPKHSCFGCVLFAIKTGRVERVTGAGHHRREHSEAPGGQEVSVNCKCNSCGHQWLHIGRKHIKCPRCGATGNVKQGAGK